MKIIAFYLPQYHAIPENDKWWGKDFTDWVNVRKARPLFKGHYQPKEPYDDNYYNLLVHKSREWQSRIAQEYGVYGFCYYHYWFKGKQLLERPIEEVVKRNDPDIPFCIAWANEPWTRAWDGGEKQILINQEYGEQNAWKSHFDYLIKIFSDTRYIKINNKPMFLIYRTAGINNCDEMLKFWDNEIKRFGFDGIHIVEMITGFQEKPFCKLSSGVVEFEPNFTLRYNVPNVLRVRRRIKRILRTTRLVRKYSLRLLDIYNYDYIWKKITDRISKYDDKVIYAGAFVDWDNSPRKGVNAIIFTGATPNKFGYYLKKQIQKSLHNYNSEFVFINAWNEWAEGTYLEPDKKNGFQYLEAVKNSILDE